MKKAINYFLCLLVVSFGCCPGEKEEGYYSGMIPYVIDSLPHSNVVVTRNAVGLPLSEINYAGNFLDTIIFHPDRMLMDGTLFLDERKYEDTVSVSDFQVFVSSQDLSFDIETRRMPPLFWLDEENPINDEVRERQWKEWQERPRNFVQTYPVFILNPTKQPLYLVSQDMRIIMIQEAKNEKGEWLPIEYWRYSDCGNSYGLIQVNSGQAVIANMYKYAGDFETELRVKLKSGKNSIYSKPFKGRINKKQFNYSQELEDLVGKHDGKYDLERLNAVFLNE